MIIAITDSEAHKKQHFIYLFIASLFEQGQLMHINKTFNM